jgi:hypothetical protein
MRTLSFNNLVIDGNPMLRENGGIKGMAEAHCVGSFVNHSIQYSNTRFKTIDYQSPNLVYRTKLELPMYSVFIMTSQNVQKHQQLLVNYQVSHFKDGTVEIPFC